MRIRKFGLAFAILCFHYNPPHIANGKRQEEGEKKIVGLIQDVMH